MLLIRLEYCLLGSSESCRSFVPLFCISTLILLVGTFFFSFGEKARTPCPSQELA